jgi:hypothetical protein
MHYTILEGTIVYPVISIKREKKNYEAKFGILYQEKKLQYQVFHIKVR